MYDDFIDSTVPLASVVAFDPAVCSNVKAVDTEIAVCVIASDISSTELEKPMKEGKLLIKFATETFC